MGITYVQATVRNGDRWAALDFLVDSGAQLSLLPLEIWRRLGLEPIDSRQFRLADGTLIERQVSECGLTIFEQSRHTPVILGEEGDEALLGVITLEEFGLVLNPFARTLQPMRMRLR
jgi:clan AA aspartic protease